MPGDPITASREVALALLKPSDRDLQYGLELHRRSLVVESYSLFRHAPVEDEPLNQALEQGASEVEYRDLAEISSMTGWLRTPELRAEYEALWAASGVTCSFANAGEEGTHPMGLIKRLARYIHLFDRLPDFLTKITDVRGLEALRDSPRRGICLSTNGVPLTGVNLNPSDELRYLPVFAQLGVRMMHLTYNRRNLIGDGCMEKANAGLSDFGESAVRAMNRHGIIIDLAHTGWQTSIDTARLSSAPVVISHAGAWALSEHMRCKSDEVIRAVVEGGGTIGITNVPRFLGRSGDIVALLDQIDYVVERFGIDAVTIGTDTGSHSIHSAAAAARLTPRPRARPGWEVFWPPGQEVRPPEWNKPEQAASLAWTNWPLFTVGLVMRGYSDEEIAKIIGGNLIRVAGQVWR